MALKAGYKGVKNKDANKLTGLANIKTIGDGLTLEDGELSAEGGGGGGTTVVANPETAASANLTRLTVGESTYAVPDDSKVYKTDDSTESAIADSDYVPFFDSSASSGSGAPRKSTWSNIKAKLKAYFDTLYNNYELPTASDSTLGGVKVGSGLSINASGVLSATGGGGDQIQYETLPTPTEALYNAGAIKQYIGATNSTYTRGFFYELIKSFIKATPNMISNNAPSGVCSASSIYIEQESAWKCFNGDTSATEYNAWLSSSSDSAPWIQYAFPSGTTKVVERLRLLNTHGDSWAPSKVVLKGSNDGSSFTSLGTFTLSNQGASQWNRFDVNNSTPYRYYRIECTKTKTYVGFNEIELMELDGYSWSKINVQ